MMPLLRIARMLAWMPLAACSPAPHPFDRYLDQLPADTVAALPEMAWPPGTVLCPLALYQSAPGEAAPPADRVNAFLKQKQFLGGEDWSLIVVKPAPAGNAGIEQLFFKRADYDVINDPQLIVRAAQTVPPGFVPRACVRVEQARVLVTRVPGSQRKHIIFGTA